MSPLPLSRAGRLGVVTGVLGALSAVVLLVFPPQVAPGPVSYPFTTTGFLVAQSWFFVHHLGLVVLLAALAVSGALGASRIARVGAWLAVLGMVLLTFAELLAMRYANWDDVTANAGPMGATYGIACTLVGLGLVVAGLCVLRAKVWPGWHRWTPLVTGLAVFVVVTPGMFGGFVWARLAIGSWMLLFAALGWSLHALSRTSVPPDAHDPLRWSGDQGVSVRARDHISGRG